MRFKIFHAVCFVSFLLSLVVVGAVRQSHFRWGFWRIYFRKWQYSCDWILFTNNEAFAFFFRALRICHEKWIRGWRTTNICSNVNIKHLTGMLVYSHSISFSRSCSSLNVFITQYIYRYRLNHFHFSPETNNKFIDMIVCIILLLAV